MALPEACGLWIEQRVQEELDAKGETGASLREIGRMVAAEVEKYFEIKVKPNTIRMRASRMQKATGTNVPPIEKSKKKRKVSQKRTWEKAVRDLSKVVSYMMENCESPADIDGKIVRQLYDLIDTLQIFYDGFEGE